MARIRIEDLPPGVKLTAEELESLTPEEIARIFGAGHQPYRPELETLEAREMMDAGLGHALPVPVPPPGGGAAPAFAHVRQMTSAAPGSPTVLNTALDTHLGTAPAPGLHGPGQQTAGHTQVGAVNPMLAPSQAAANAQAKFVIDRWFARYMCSGGPWVDPRTGHTVETKRIQRLDPGLQNDTVSEGIGYGMLAAVKSGDKPTFDALWAYARKNFNKNGLMAWHIDQAGHATDMHAASDADEDMAMSLILAYKQWGEGSYYKEDAKALIANLKNFEVDPNTHNFMAGDWWKTATPMVDPSYLAPAYYKVFQEFTGDKFWGQVADQSYHLLDVALKAGGNTGLVPDWMTPEGGPVPGRSHIYGYDAIRTPWRIALDAAWYGDQRAITYLTKVNDFVKSKGIAHIAQTYNLNGTTSTPDPNAGSIAMAATAAIVDADSTYRNQVWEAVKNAHLDVYPSGDYGYYNEALRLQSTLLIGGMMEKPVIEQPVS
jgi:endo-1,4-beta-D-glucanase Y